MEHTSGDYALMSLGIIGGCVVETDEARSQTQGVAGDIVAGPDDWNPDGGGVNDQIALDVQFLEGAEEVRVACGVPLEIVEYGAGEKVYEVGVQVLSVEFQVEAGALVVARNDYA